MLYRSEIRRLLASVSLPMLMMASGCATSGVDDVPCAGDTDCPIGQLCDPETLQCKDGAIEITNNGRVPPVNNNGTLDRDMGGGEGDTGEDGVQPDVGAPGGNDLGVPDMGTTDAGSPDMPAPATCTPACAANEVCSDGQCVSACMPACSGGQVCTANGCTFPDCTAPGQPCDENRPEQNGYACISYDGAGRCFDYCDTAGEPSTCPLTEYCVSAGTRAVCVPSACATDADCGADSCVALANEHKVCVTAGTTPLGGTCNPDTNGCVQGTYCRVEGASGVCSQICDPFAASPGCPSGQSCASPLTTRTSLCTPETSIGSTPFALCRDPGEACDDAMLCFTQPTDGVCLQYCRDDANDCAGITAGGDPTVCQLYALPARGELGVCLLPCASASDCGASTDWVCQSGQCRIRCTSATVNEDCCGTTTSCGYTCNSNGLCE